MPFRAYKNVYKRARIIDTGEKCCYNSCNAMFNKMNMEVVWSKFIKESAPILSAALSFLLFALKNKKGGRYFEKGIPYPIPGTRVCAVPHGLY